MGPLHLGDENRWQKRLDRCLHPRHEQQALHWSVTQISEVNWPHAGLSFSKLLETPQETAISTGPVQGSSGPVQGSSAVTLKRGQLVGEVAISLSDRKTYIQVHQDT